MEPFPSEIARYIIEQELKARGRAPVGRLGATYPAPQSWREVEAADGGWH